MSDFVCDNFVGSVK